MGLCTGVSLTGPSGPGSKGGEDAAEKGAGTLHTRQIA